MNTESNNYSEDIKNKLEEIDEFEDFPIDNWPDSETIKNIAKQEEGQKESLWQEDWNDVEVDDDFAKNLQDELEKARAQQN